MSYCREGGQSKGRKPQDLDRNLLEPMSKEEEASGAAETESRQRQKGATKGRDGGRGQQKAIGQKIEII